MVKKVMYFCAERFVENADVSTVRLLGRDHIEALAGKPVVFDKEKLGMVESYMVGGKEFYLYPVYEEWCTSNKQNDLFF